MVTPLRDRDVLDVGGLEKLLEHILAGGVSGLVHSWHHRRRARA